MKIFLHEMKANLKSLLLWSLGMAFLIAAGAGKYTGMSSAGQSTKELMASMPKSIQVLFGFNGLDVSTIRGFYGMLFLFIVLLASVHAATLGGGIFSKEERDRTFEFLYVRPISRSRIAVEKILATVMNMLILNIVSLAVSVGITAKVANDNISKDILVLMAGMFIMQLVFASIGLAISVILKNSKAAAGIASMVVVIMYLLSVISDLADKLEFLKFFTPFKYFSAQTIYDTGLNWLYITVSAVVIAVALLTAWVMHNKRDLTV